MPPVIPLKATFAAHMVTLAVRSSKSKTDAQCWCIDRICSLDKAAHWSYIKSCRLQLTRAKAQPHGVAPAEWEMSARCFRCSFADATLARCLLLVRFFHPHPHARVSYWKQNASWADDSEQMWRRTMTTVAPLWSDDTGSDCRGWRGWSKCPGHSAGWGKRRRKGKWKTGLAKPAVRTNRERDERKTGTVDAEMVTKSQRQTQAGFNFSTWKDGLEN